MGAQKAGTTTLQALLATHPQVFLPQAKELQFFSFHHQRGEGWYRQQFEDARAGQVCGEITPYYLFHPLAPQRIQALLPEVRLIVLLRDPVARTLSGLFHSIRLGLEPLPPEQALAAEAMRLAGAEAQLLAGAPEHSSHQLHSYLSRSRYGHQLARYEQWFAADRLLLLRSEDLFAAPELVWPRLLAFLGLEAHPLPARLPRRNPGGGEAEQVPMALRRRLRRQLAPTYALMAERYGIAWP